MSDTQPEFETVWELTPEQRERYEEAMQLLQRAGKIMGDAEIPHIIATVSSRRVSSDGRRGREGINCGCFAPMTENEPRYSKVIAEMEKAYLVTGGYEAGLRARKEREQTPTAG